MIPLLLAHLSSAHWYVSLLYLLPVFVVFSAIMWARLQDRRARRAEAGGKQTRRPKR